jgi:hypothetical protein
MPEGPKGQKRPGDVISDAIKVARIATGDAKDQYAGPPEKSSAAVELGRKGGRRRADTMSAERRAEFAKKAAESRWRNGD